MNHSCRAVEANINQFLKSKAFWDSQIDLTFDLTFKETLQPRINQLACLDTGLFY